MVYIPECIYWIHELRQPQREKWTLIKMKMKILFKISKVLKVFKLNILTPHPSARSNLYPYRVYSRLICCVRMRTHAQLFIPIVYLYTIT